MSAIFRKINLSKNRDTVIKNNIFIGDVNGDICFDFGDYANKTIPINWELR